MARATSLSLLSSAFNEDNSNAVEDIKEAMTEINQVNFNSPIQGYADLNKLAKSTNKILAKTATELKNTSAFSGENESVHGVMGT
jgi:hypothetical protein